MVDNLSKEKRHEVMSKIKSKDTKLEISVRLWLYHNGIRYRKNCKTIVGKPDIAIKKYKIAIFVNGCFWHGHNNCKLYQLPKSRIEFWENKINRNKFRDEENIKLLINKGWKVFVLWECQINSSFNEIMTTLLNNILEIKNAKIKNCIQNK